jgi:hypothetical protein
MRIERSPEVASEKKPPKKRKLAPRVEWGICRSRVAAMVLEQHVIESHGNRAWDTLKAKAKPKRKVNRKTATDGQAKKRGSTTKKKSKSQRIVETAERRAKQDNDQKKATSAKRKPVLTKRPKRRAISETTKKLSSDQEERVQNRDTPDGNPLYGDWY